MKQASVSRNAFKTARLNMIRAGKCNKQLIVKTGIEADEQKEVSRAADSLRR